MGISITFVFDLIFMKNCHSILKIIITHGTPAPSTLTSRTRTPAPQLTATLYLQGRFLWLYTVIIVMVV